MFYLITSVIFGLLTFFVILIIVLNHKSKVKKANKPQKENFDKRYKFWLEEKIKTYKINYFDYLEKITSTPFLTNFKETQKFLEISYKLEDEQIKTIIADLANSQINFNNYFLELESKLLNVMRELELQYHFEFASFPQLKNLYETYTKLFSKYYFNGIMVAKLGQYLNYSPTITCQMEDYNSHIQTCWTNFTNGMNETYLMNKQVLTEKKYSSFEQNIKSEIQQENLSTELIWAYKILKVDQNATNLEIKQSFRKLANKYHPDKNKKKTAKEEMKKITMAYNYIKDIRK